MSGPEANYQKRLMQQLRARGAYVVKYPAGPHGAKGVPDLLCCYRGRFIALELKAGNPALAQYAPTINQEHQLDAIHRAGGIALVSWPASDALSILDDIDQLFDAVL